MTKKQDRIYIGNQYLKTTGQMDYIYTMQELIKTLEFLKTKNLFGLKALHGFNKLPYLVAFKMVDGEMTQPYFALLDNGFYLNNREKIFDLIRKKYFKNYMDQLDANLIIDSWYYLDPIRKNDKPNYLKPWMISTRK